MSDTAAEFERKTKAMIDLALGQLDLIGKLFASKIIFQVVYNTPGPNNQLPETEYIAVGRLRGGYHLWEAQAYMASRWEGGPYDEDGHGETVAAALHDEIMSAPMQPVYYLNNDVAYGYIVHYGGGRMPYPRPWRDIAASEANQIVALREATAEAMAA